MAKVIEIRDYYNQELEVWTALTKDEIRDIEGVEGVSFYGPLPSSHFVVAVDGRYSVATVQADMVRAANAKAAQE